MNEKISIIVPVYNGEESIERCIQSVFRLKYGNWEMIIINDGSNDNTKNICQKYTYDKRIKLINKQNEGVSVARNIGIYNATGEYIVFLDSDDYLEEDMCNVFVENIKNSDWCIAGYKQHYKDNKIIQKLPIKQLNENKYTLEEFSEVFENLYLSGFINSPWAKCYRKELITTFFDSKLFLGEDLIFNLNYLKNCKNIKYTNSAVYNYIIQDEGSLSSDLKEQSFEVIYEVYKESKRILSGMFEHEHMWKKAVSQKFTIDMLVLVERGIRSGKIINYESMEQIIKKYEIRRLSNGIDSMIYGLKWRVILYLLENKNYKCIYMFFVVIFKVKKLRRK